VWSSVTLDCSCAEVILQGDFQLVRKVKTCNAPTGIALSTCSSPEGDARSQLSNLRSPSKNEQVQFQTDMYVSICTGIPASSEGNPGGKSYYSTDVFLSRNPKLRGDDRRKTSPNRDTDGGGTEILYVWPYSSSRIFLRASRSVTRRSFRER
jgi:hypothetical protein